MTRGHPKVHDERSRPSSAWTTRRTGGHCVFHQNDNGVIAHMLVPLLDMYVTVDDK